MSNIFQASPYAYLPEEDAATISKEDVPALIESGAISPQQPGLVYPSGYVAPPETAITTTTGGGGGGGPTEIPINPDFIRSFYEGSGKNRVRYDVYSDGVRGPFSDPGDEDEGVDENDGDDTAGGGIDQNAFARLKGYLNEFGLSSLDGMLQELLARGITDEEGVLFELRNTDAFKTRFKANEIRRAAGLPALTPRSYVDLENTYREVLRRGGMLEYFNNQEIFESLIGGDVSPAELYDRMTNAYQVVRDADPGVKSQMRELYNVEERDLAAYFLDPKTSVSMLKRRAEAARIAAIGKEQGQMQLGVDTAEDLAARGFTTAQAGEAFTKMTQLTGLYESLSGEEEFGKQKRFGSAFGYDPLAQMELERRKEGRKAEFRGGGQFASTRGQTSGVVETGAGMAQ